VQQTQNIRATKNSALLLAKGFVALKKSFVAIFSPRFPEPEKQQSGHRLCWQ
jgi:hypothetical protein